MNLIGRNTILYGIPSLLCLLPVFLLIFIISLLQKSHENDVTTSITSYRYQEIDSQNRTGSGFVDLNRRILHDEFISYPGRPGRSGSTVIISSLVSSQYTCTGSCLCSDGERRASQVLSRSLFILISAFSSTTAVKIAEMAFQNLCEDEFPSSCDNDIESEVSSCTVDTESSSTTTSTSTSSENNVLYSCTGHCLPKRLKGQSSNAQNDFFENEGNCEDLKTKGIVQMERRVGKNKWRGTNIKGQCKEYDHRFAHMYPYAQCLFMKTFLKSFCKEASRRKFNYLSPKGVKGVRKVNMCVGVNKDGDSSKYKFDNVKCMLLKPFRRKA